MKHFKNNPRKISETQLQELEVWLRELGDLGGVVHDLNSDQIIGGNQRSTVFDINQCEIVIKEKFKKPDKQGTVALGYVMWEGNPYSYRQVRWTKKQCEKANIIANKAGGEWDEELLKKFFKQGDLSKWGFSSDELDDLFADMNEKKKVDAPARFDEAKKLLKHWDVKVGDVWALGEHRLICGDSSDGQVVKRLFESYSKKPVVASLMSSDPPYMVDYDGTARPGGGKDWSETYQESNIEDKQKFLVNVFKAWQPYLSPRAAWFIWHASSTASIFEKALEAVGVFVHQQIVWVKPIFILGFSVYYYQHEPCFFGWVKGNKPFMRKKFFDGRETTVWEGLGLDTPQENERGYSTNDKHADILAVLYEGSSVWHIDWQGKKRPVKNNHPTEKPVEIFARPMRNHTKPGDVCVEPFSGSGSQILAGEQEGRIVLACDIEPTFVAVALQRYEDATGKKPKRLERG